MENEFYEIFFRKCFFKNDFSEFFGRSFCKAENIFIQRKTLKNKPGVLSFAQALLTLIAGQKNTQERKKNIFSNVRKATAKAYKQKSHFFKNRPHESGKNPCFQTLENKKRHASFFRKRASKSACFKLFFR
ncbi:MAG: hypothetical protein SOT81_09555 [Treponema sp.]|nr:hypothetical protein [Treponema sp.]